MLKIKKINIPGYEQVIHVTDPECGLNGFIAIHNTTLGPALGGLRIYPYLSEDDALTDVLRLAKGMTYKSALCETGLGGGKATIIGDPKKIDPKKLLPPFAEAINSLQGKYITAEDLGTNEEDMIVLKQYTPYVCTLPNKKGSGDPSHFTAWGVFLGIKAAAAALWNNSLKGKTVAIQGLGHVGEKLAAHLFWEGANLLLTDTDPYTTEHIASHYGAEVIKPEAIYSTPCDIFAPCAIGGILNAKTIPTLHCQAVAGSANNQLLTEEDGVRLHMKNILYAPDYVINAGGLYNAAAEFDPTGYNPRTSRDRVSTIYPTLLQIFTLSKKQNKPSSQVADELAEYKLTHGIGRRTIPIY